MSNTVYDIKRLRNSFLKSYHNNDFDKAKQKGNQLLDYYKTNNLIFDRDYGNDLFNVACAYDEAADYEGAIKLYLRSADEVQRRSGNCLKLSDIYNNLGIANNELHRVDTALAYFKKCYNLRYTIAGEDSEAFTEASYNLGSAYKNMHRYTDAAQYYAKALNGRENKDIAYADNLYNLGMCYIETKDYEIGLKYIEKALEIYKGITANPEEYLTALAVYSSILYKVKRYEDAKNSYNELIEHIKDNFGTTQTFYATALSMLADCYAKLDNTDTAITLKQKALNIVKKSLGTSHIFYSTYLAELAELYMQSKELAKAAALYDEAFDIRSKILGMNNEECINYVHILANIYSLMKLYKKAEDLLNYAISNMQRTNRGYTKTVLELVKLYMETQNGEGLNRAYSYFNSIHPEKSFDEMLDLAEEL